MSILAQAQADLDAAFARQVLIRVLHSKPKQRWMRELVPESWWPPLLALCPEGELLGRAAAPHLVTLRVLDLRADRPDLGRLESSRILDELMRAQDEQVIPAMEQLAPGCHLLVQDTLPRLVARPEDRENGWRSRFRMHTIYAMTGDRAVGWITKGLWPADAALRLVSMTLPREAPSTPLGA